MGVDYKVGTCEKCGGFLIYLHSLDKIICEDFCDEEDEDDE